MKAHALTIDLEDWHQLAHRRVTGDVIQPTPAVVTDTHRLLDLLEEAGIRATFFVVGNVADAYPELVREVARRGHEIGSHSYSHELISCMEPAAFKADMERSLKQLQELTGQPVLGFRAPEFSVGSLNHWCFEILAELGFRYDSSVFPIAGARYGIPAAPRHPLLTDFVRFIEELAGRKAQLVPAPMMEADVPYTYADISKARPLLGYDPKVPVQEGVQRLWHWYQQAVLG